MYPDLVQTAAAEHKVATYASSRSPNSSTNASTVAQLIPSLQAAVESEEPLTADRLQAQTCLGWILFFIY